ncbi:KAT8 regulatory NSL complex subunit 1 isoform X1 [Xenopus tropicalis]|uniref:KAT8 regulatory NSL complex subunit 1 isoform X1 n=1 Tax=Xenopus tropicalis TaxID=8364 RepID=F6X6J1_XENTR|nr:KAT8 regulatory NSL complex subunit 1 isoform X1 [Xenopus tropicalis]XP_031750086.1 KAT8 regulatory NSL complex subunit 1 isoform X1 [Xenopus tropicalis]XP_031750087.1 KAT8 regulatory NSL complex subunit 1 isoform X1 [Xenopus tropicalis]XP_031750088.1 KAT8 regulatory NSL complex subunit 1 isoform X1 [Xenopus tropicalis]
MAAMAPALTDPAPDAHNLHFKLAPPSSSLPLGEVNGGSLPPPAAPDLVASYCGTISKDQLKLAGVLGPGSILSQSLCRGRPSILEINLEELRGITNSGRGGQGGPLNGLAKKLNKPAVDRPPGHAVPNLETWVKTQAVSPESPTAAQEEKGIPVEPGSGARLQALLRRHGEMEERARRLQKRLRLVQAKQVERHLHQQLGGLVGASINRTVESPRSRLTVLTRKAEAQRRVEEEGAGSDAFLKEAAPELAKLSLSGGAALRACELGFDSDATESSSGGDSDIEEEELNRADTRRNHMPLKRRCEWSWAQERADVVSRWNWLQAHVSDLEYRIRQHTDFYRQLRSGKGQVVLGEACPSETAGEPLRSSLLDSRTSSSPSPDAERRADSSTTEAKSLQRPINGIVNMLPPVLPTRSGSDTQELALSKPLSPQPDSTCVCARTRPLVTCKRRRIVRPDRLLPLNKKVQRGTPHVCEVSSSCVMCASLPGPSAEIQYSDPLAERLALLDPSIHPVLSFPDDIPTSLRLLSLLRSHKQDRSKSIKKLKLRPLNQLPSTPELPRGDRLQGAPNVHRVSHHRPADLTPKQPLEPPLRTLKIDRSLISRSDPLVTSSAPHVKRRQLGVPDRNAGAQQVDPSISSPAPVSASPVSQPPLIRQLSASSEGQISSYSASVAARRRRTESSYDINNIVIPMSVAATTRVERLQYKEILTPSWRVVHITPVTPNNEEDSEELEDLSDAAFSELHAKCEEQERARWLSSVPPQRRGSRTHRTSESSVTPSAGTRPLTPQPSSPDTGSWQAIPDFSPLSPDVLSAPPTPTSRETSRLLSEETQSSISDSGREELAVQPWERRNFPLSYSPKRELTGPCEPTDWGGARPPRRPSCSSKTAKDPEDPPSSPPCPVSRPRPLHR